MQHIGEEATELLEEEIKLHKAGDVKRNENTGLRRKRTCSSSSSAVEVLIIEC